MKEIKTIRKEGPNFRIDIGELVLHGSDKETKYEIASQIKQELVRLMIENGTPQINPKSSNKFTVENIKIDQLQDNTKVGAGIQVAQSIYKMILEKNDNVIKNERKKLNLDG